jgi:hypothetical protein
LPAKAGIKAAPFWVPACAGTTTLARGVPYYQSAEWLVLACEHFVRRS